jgi:hypothetical protein
MEGEKEGSARRNGEGGVASRGMRNCGGERGKNRRVEEERGVGRGEGGAGGEVGTERERPT